MRTMLWLLLPLLVSACSRPEGSTPSAVGAAPLVACVVADMGSVDPKLVALATGDLNAGADRTDAWALSSLLNGGLIISNGTVDVWRAGAQAGLTQTRSQLGKTTTKSGAPTTEAMAAFTAEAEKADRLCDVSVAAIGGVTHHYVHVERQADGSLVTRGAFFARNPELSSAGADQTDLVAAFKALVAATL